SRWIALYVLCLGTLKIVLDVTIVNVALPSVKEDLGFSQSSLAWVVNAYLLTYGGCLLLGGRLGDLFGHRRLFLIGICFFTAASRRDGPPRRRRRRNGDRRADARRLRDRERQPERLDVGRDARPACSRRSAVRRLRLDRGSCPGAAGAAASLRAPQPHGRERRRHPLGGGDVRVVLPVGAVPAARARVLAAPGRARLPAVEPDH